MIPGLARDALTAVAVAVALVAVACAGTATSSAGDVPPGAATVTLAITGMT